MEQADGMRITGLKVYA